MAVCQAPWILNVAASSRAGSLPQWFCGAHRDPLSIAITWRHSVKQPQQGFPGQIQGIRVTQLAFGQRALRLVELAFSVFADRCRWQHQITAGLGGQLDVAGLSAATAMAA